jgi:predicted hotdog family 3-hydroxylacyl-ACP dehydratase
MEVAMNNRDALIRSKLLDRLTAVGVDARNLVVEVAAGTVTVQGAVPTDEERERAMGALIGAHTLEISVRRVASADTAGNIAGQ